jgi:hypothetical protein
MAAEVIRIDRRRNNPVRRVFGKNNFRTHHLLRSGDSINQFDQTLP